MNGNGQRRPAEIQAEIDRTRDEMDGTLRLIEQRLTPGQLMDQGLDYLKNSGAKEFASNLGSSVKDNPLPVALVGIGLAWLMAAGKSSGSASLSSSSLGASARQSMDSAKERASQVADSARETWSQIGGKANDMAESARYQVERAKGSLNTMIEEQPLALGAIGLAIGAVLAASAPRTRQEDRIMGEASDRLKEQAKEVAKQQAQVLQEKAQTAEQSVKSKSDGGDSGKPAKPRVTVPTETAPVPRGSQSH
jgi:hypothetical protein